jgi:hypothetical protein
LHQQNGETFCFLENLRVKTLTCQPFDTVSRLTLSAV